MPEAPLTTDLILRGRIAKQPLTLAGTLEGGQLTEISGRCTIEKSLSQILEALGDDFKGARETLGTLPGNTGSLDTIKLHSLAFRYLNIEPRLAQVAMAFAVKRNLCRFVCLKRLGEQGGYVAGLELQLDKDFFKGNVISGLLGEISLGHLGIYLASRAFQNVQYDGGQDFQDAGKLTLNLPDIKGRDFTQGMNWSAQILI